MSAMCQEIRKEPINEDEHNTFLPWRTHDPKKDKDMTQGK